MNLRQAAASLQEAISKAIAQRGSPNTFGLGELHVLHGGPPAMLAGRAIPYVCGEWRRLTGVSFIRGAVVCDPSPPPALGDTGPGPGLARAESSIAALLREEPGRCVGCERVAYVTGEERMRGKWTCYRCGRVNTYSVTRGRVGG